MTIRVRDLDKRRAQKRAERTVSSDLSRERRAWPKRARRRGGEAGLEFSITERALKSHGDKARASNAAGGGLEIEMQRS